METSTTCNNGNIGTNNPLGGTFHRKALPSPAVAFSSLHGRKIFLEALLTGGMENYYTLAESYQTQGHPAYCGLGSLTMILNAMLLDPKRIWQGVWRWFDDTNVLTCCSTHEHVQNHGITLPNLHCLALCNGAQSELKFAQDITIDTFREDVRASCCSSIEDTSKIAIDIALNINKQGDPSTTQSSSSSSLLSSASLPPSPITANSTQTIQKYLLASYSRSALNQTGTGHFSPIGGYNSQCDSALIMDVARFKYPPHWVPLPLLYESMQRVDPETGLSRGYLLLSLPSPSALPSVRVDCCGSECKRNNDNINMIDDVKNIITTASSSNDITHSQTATYAVSGSCCGINNNGASCCGSNAKDSLYKDSYEMNSC